MSRVHNKKIAAKYADDLDVMFGDDVDIFGNTDPGKTSGQASTWLDAISMAAKGGAEIAQKNADSKRAEADAKKKIADEAKARDARRAADAARTTAELAAYRAANAPTDTKLQEAAFVAKQEFNRLDMIAREAEMKAGMSAGLPSAGGLVPASSSSMSDRPWYFWPAIVGGVVLGGAVIYKVVSSSRLMREAK